MTPLARSRGLKFSQASPPLLEFSSPGEGRLPRLWASCIAILLLAGSLVPSVRAQGLPPASVYAQPTPTREPTGTNDGAIRLDLATDVVSDNMFRGRDRSERGGSEDSPNVQIDTRLTLDSGKIPHPFVGIFVNLYDSDPINRFQEVRPCFGLDWNLRPLHFTLWHNSFIFPDIEKENTGEVCLEARFDDTVVFNTAAPILNPYLLASYDYSRFTGWYVELGLRPEIPIGETGVTAAPHVAVAWAFGNEYYQETDYANGLQHYKVGLEFRYSFNAIAGIGPRYGNWSLRTYVNYADGIDNHVLHDREVWWGMGITLSY